MAVDFKTLRKIADLKALKNRQKFQALLSRENGIRAEIGHLQEMRSEALSANLALMPMRAIGSDVLWQGWLDRKSSEKTIELAQVKATMEPLKEKIRTDLGRSEATKELEKRDALARRKAIASQQLDQAVEVASVQRILKAKKSP